MKQALKKPEWTKVAQWNTNSWCVLSIWNL